ncbi:MAG: hypothetical protein ACYDDI_14640 [Candidatus Acidiferrales bacterium]
MRKTWVVCILCMTSVGIVCGQGTPKHGVAKKDGRSNAQQAASPKNKQSDSSNKPSFIPEHSGNAPQGDGNHTGDDVEIQGKLTTYTKYLVVVGFLQATILLLTVWAIFGQTRTTKDSERAWIVVSPDKWNPGLAVMPDAGEIPLNVFEVWVKNLGKTPAKIIGMASKYVKLERMEDLPFEPNYKDA